jgi:hypothetical protein
LPLRALAAADGGREDPLAVSEQEGAVDPQSSGVAHLPRAAFPHEFVAVGQQVGRHQVAQDRARQRSGEDRGRSEVSTASRLSVSAASM